MTMRISTSSIYSASATQMGTLQSQLARTQQQLSTQRRMLSAADDPIASARALEVTQSQSINTQFATNRANARAALAQEETVLTGVGSLIQDMQSIGVAAGNGIISASDRASYATQLQGQLDDLLSLANSSDGNGGYMFAGFKSTTVPFVQTVNGVRYDGDQGQVQLQVASSRKVATGDPGSSVFAGLPTGNGTFTTSPGGANTGTGTISVGTVSSPQLVTGHSYSIDFSVAGTPAVTQYQVNDTSNGTSTPVGLPATYTPGASITVAGMTFEVNGAPADTDSFAVEPSMKQSLFDTVSQMIATLRAPANTAAEKKALSDGVTQANRNLSGALDNVLSVRASVGTRMKEFDTLDSVGEDTNIQYAATLSKLQDLDLIQAYSQFTQQQATLEAAQKTFKSVSGLSLFNFIS
ncbi:MAG: flagellar hook protein [Massilia sp.]|nr:flagellar hook protein [Massilia sp.]